MEIIVHISYIDAVLRGLIPYILNTAILLAIFDLFDAAIAGVIASFKHGVASRGQIELVPHGCLYNTSQPSKHKTFVQYLYNAGQTSSTLVQRCINIIQMFRVCWEYIPANTRS